MKPYQNISIIALALTSLACSQSDAERLKLDSRINSIKAAIGNPIDKGEMWGPWKVSSVGISEKNPNVTIVKVEIPDTQASAIMSFNSFDQLNAVGGMACPSKKHPVWAEIPSDGTIFIEGMTSGTTFIDVDCRSYGPI